MTRRVGLDVPCRWVGHLGQLGGGSSEQSIGEKNIRVLSGVTPKHVEKANQNILS